MKTKITSPKEEAAIGKMISECMAMRSRLISRMITAIYDEEFRSLGMGTAQFCLLLVIHRLQPATRAEIGRFHHQDRSTLARNLKVLFAEGWVEEIDDQAGGRRKPVMLTKAGRDLVLKAEPAWHIAQKRAAALLGAEGFSIVTGIANRILTSSSAN